MQLPVSHTHLPPFLAILNASPKLKKNPSGCFLARILFSILGARAIATIMAIMMINNIHCRIFEGSFWMSSGSKKVATTHNKIYKPQVMALIAFTWRRFFTQSIAIKIRMRAHIHSIATWALCRAGSSVGNSPPLVIRMTNMRDPVKANMRTKMRM